MVTDVMPFEFNTIGKFDCCVICNREITGIINLIAAIDALIVRVKVLLEN